MTLRDKIYEMISKDSLVYKGLDNLFCYIAKSLSLTKDKVSLEFDKMMQNGDIFEIRKGKYITIPSHGYAKGVFLGNAKGFGFVQTGAVKGEHDIFVPGNKTLGAIDGEKVIVKINAQTSEGSEGEIVKIYKSANSLVGVVNQVGDHFFVQPDNNHIPFDIRLIKSELKFAKDDRVVVKVLRHKEKLSGQVIEVLGKSDDVKAMEKGIIREHELYESFPDDVIAECDKLSMSVKACQKKNRLDLTKEEIFTIDGEDAQDFDDAVSIKRTGKGYILGVHIADVGEYVKKDSSLDEEAFNRGTSVYFPKSVLPMLPEVLSNGVCSLQEGVDRLTLSCIMEIDKNGKVVNYQICESVIKSVARLTYNQVNDLFNGKESKASKVKKSLFNMLELSKILQANKIKNGYLDFEIPECEFIFDEEGKAIDVVKRERNAAHRLIEDFMVLANEVVAKSFKIKGVPFVYRVHEAPRKEKLTAVKDFMEGLGISVPNLPEEIKPDYYQSLLKLVDGKDYESIVNKVLLRSMQKAKYMNKNLGHFGLALEYYCHFTSPIRRYPDLTIHRIIKETLHKKALSKTRMEELGLFTFEASEQSSLTERNAEKAEREVDDLWKAYIMKDKIGQEFEATISSVTSYGVFVELENGVEGLVRIEDLPQDGYLFLEKQLKLQGQNHTFRLGDRINVILIKANIFTRKLDFAYKKG